MKFDPVYSNSDVTTFDKPLACRDIPGAPEDAAILHFGPRAVCLCQTVMGPAIRLKLQPASEALLTCSGNVATQPN